jgi:hypothetical protein
MVTSRFVEEVYRVPARYLRLESEIAMFIHGEALVKAVYIME